MDNKEYLVFTHLHKLVDCDLSLGWGLIKQYIRKYVGKNKFICIPYISDGSLYNVFAIFVKTAETGFILKHGTYKICGNLEQWMNKEETSIEWKKPSCESSPCNLPEVITITLLDLASERMVRAVVQGFQRNSIPAHKSPTDKVYLKLEKELYGSRVVYMVNDIIAASSMELHIVVGSYSRIYYVGETQPLLFSYQKYQLNENGKIVAKKWTSIDEKYATWKPILMDRESMSSHSIANR